MNERVEKVGDTRITYKTVDGKGYVDYVGEPLLLLAGVAIMINKLSDDSGIPLDVFMRVLDSQVPEVGQILKGEDENE